jgi:hypothetical protein
MFSAHCHRGAVPLDSMSLQPGMIKGASARDQQRSHVDYRLARRSIIRNFQNGRLSRMDVCDAHPELLRAARGVGELSGELCPICEKTNVVLVSYVFGPGLAAGGHCVTNRTELRKMARRTSELTCYVVEVCPECSWNHLAQSFHVPGHRRHAAG